MSQKSMKHEKISRKLQSSPYEWFESIGTILKELVGTKILTCFSSSFSVE